MLADWPECSLAAKALVHVPILGMGQNWVNKLPSLKALHALNKLKWQDLWCCRSIAHLGTTCAIHATAGITDVARLQLHLRCVRHGSCLPTRWCNAHHQQVILWHDTPSKASLVLFNGFCFLSFDESSEKSSHPPSTITLVTLHCPTASPLSPQIQTYCPS